MRILTVRQPWAWAIIHGGKDIENRVRNIAGDYRGPVAIHAARADAEGAPESLWLKHADFYRDLYRSWGVQGEVIATMRAYIIGVVDLSDVHVCRSSNRGFMTPVCFDPVTPIGATCSEWAQFEPNTDTYHLELANPRPLPEPIPFKGALGLRTLDDDTTARILAQIGEPA
jgi:hypothetical protein